LKPVQLLRLTRRDSVDVVCELLRSAERGAQVWVVFPRRAISSKGLFGLKRIRRVADSCQIDLRTVIHGSLPRNYARNAGLAVYRALPLKLWGHARAARTSADVRPQMTRYGGKLAPWWSVRPVRLGIGVVLLATIIIAFLGMVLVGATAALLPSAKIVLQPSVQVVKADLEVTASPAYREIDFQSATIPARSTRVIVSGRGETPATERIDVNDEHASGKAVFANRTDSTVLVPKGTIVRTSSGTSVRFYTLADIELPAELYGHARVGIVAMEAGPVGNVKALNINTVEGEIADLVDVINDEPTDGGTITRAPIVSNADYGVLRAQMIEHLQSEAYEQLTAELEINEFVPPESLDVQVMSQQFDQVIDERSDVLSMEMQVVAIGTAIDGESLEELATQLLLSRANGAQRVIDDSVSIIRSDRSIVDDDGIHFSILVEGQLAPLIDDKVVKREIVAMPVAEAALWLYEELPLQSAPQITVSPPFWTRIPLLPGRITVQISSEAS